MDLDPQLVAQAQTVIDEAKRPADAVLSMACNLFTVRVSADVPAEVADRISRALFLNFARKVAELKSSGREDLSAGALVGFDAMLLAALKRAGFARKEG